jgi:hypothetical protein
MADIVSAVRRHIMKTLLLMMICVTVFVAGMFLAHIQDRTEWAKTCRQQAAEKLEAGVSTNTSGDYWVKTGRQQTAEKLEAGVSTNTSGDYCVGIGVKALKNNNR